MVVSRPLEVVCDGSDVLLKIAIDNHLKHNYRNINGGGRLLRL
jgi:hypothetical protein